MVFHPGTRPFHALPAPSEILQSPIDWHFRDLSFRDGFFGCDASDSSDDDDDDDDDDDGSTIVPARGYDISEVQRGMLAVATLSSAVATCYFTVKTLKTHGVAWVLVCVGLGGSAGLFLGTLAGKQLPEEVGKDNE